MLGKDRTVYVWRKEDEQYAASCLGVGSYCDPNPRVIFWSCVSIVQKLWCRNTRPRRREEFQETRRSMLRLSMCESNLWPVGFCWWALDVQNRLSCMIWPSGSPDINIIENVWRELKSSLKRRLHEISTRTDLDLIRVVLEICIWAVLPPAYIPSLYRSILIRIRQVYRANGSIIRYWHLQVRKILYCFIFCFQILEGCPPFLCSKYWTSTLLPFSDHCKLWTEACCQWAQLSVQITIKFTAHK